MQEKTEADKPKVVHRNAPNRQKFERELAEIKSQIEAIEAQLQRINGTGPNCPQSRLQQFKEQRETANERRKVIISQLKELKKQIDCKRDLTSGMRSKLQYESEQQIEDLAHKLELQLQHHSFRLAEERRLVAEIDKLRRSKKAVRLYAEAKHELDQLRESQQNLRLERDTISNTFAAVQKQEDAVHQQLRKNKDTVDALKKELSALHEKKRNRVAEFKEEQALFVEYRDQKRAEANKLRQQEKQAISQAKAEERQELLNNVEPFEEERQLCATLLSFLGKIEMQTPSTPANCSFPNTPMSPVSPGARDDLEDKLLSEMESLYCGIPRKPSKKVKRSTSRASQAKKRPLTLTPDLLVQFDKISIKVPVNALEIPATIEAIKAQQKLYSRMATAAIAERDAQKHNKEESPKEKSPSSSPRDLTLPLTMVATTSSQEENRLNIGDQVQGHS